MRTIDLGGGNFTSEPKAKIEQPIGFLTYRAGEKGPRVVGHCCASKVETTSPVYPVNIGDYKQSCCECGAVLMPGQPCGSLAKATYCDKGTEAHTHWCELFNGT